VGIFEHIFRTERFPRTSVGFCFLESISKVANVCWRVDAINGQIVTIPYIAPISSIFFSVSPPLSLTLFDFFMFVFVGGACTFSIRTLPIFVCHARVSRLQLINQKKRYIYINRYIKENPTKIISNENYTKRGLK